MYFFKIKYFFSILLFFCIKNTEADSSAIETCEQAERMMYHAASCNNVKEMESALAFFKSDTSMQLKLSSVYSSLDQAMFHSKFDVVKTILKSSFSQNWQPSRRMKNLLSNNFIPWLIERGDTDVLNAITNLRFYSPFNNIKILEKIIRIATQKKHFHIIDWLLAPPKCVIDKKLCEDTKNQDNDSFLFNWIYYLARHDQYAVSTMESIPATFSENGLNYLLCFGLISPGLYPIAEYIMGVKIFRDYIDLNWIFFYSMMSSQWRLLDFIHTCQGLKPVSNIYVNYFSLVAIEKNTGQNKELLWQLMIPRNHISPFSLKNVLYGIIDWEHWFALRWIKQAPYQSRIKQKSFNKVFVKCFLKKPEIAIQQFAEIDRMSINLNQEQIDEMFLATLMKNSKHHLVWFSKTHKYKLVPTEKAMCSGLLLVTQESCKESFEWFFHLSPLKYKTLTTKSIAKVLRYMDTSNNWNLFQDLIMPNQFKPLTKDMLGKLHEVFTSHINLGLAHHQEIIEKINFYDNFVVLLDKIKSIKHRNMNHESFKNYVQEYGDGMRNEPKREGHLYTALEFGFSCGLLQGTFNLTSIISTLRAVFSKERAQSIALDLLLGSNLYLEEEPVEEV